VVYGLADHGILAVVAMLVQLREGVNL
jgi:hypothetical protein